MQVKSLRGAGAQPSNLRTSPARVQLPQMNTRLGGPSFGIARRASSTSGPGRARPPEAERIASTNMADVARARLPPRPWPHAAAAARGTVPHPLIASSRRSDAPADHAMTPDVGPGQRRRPDCGRRPATTPNHAAAACSDARAATAAAPATPLPLLQSPRLHPARRALRHGVPRSQLRHYRVGAVQRATAAAEQARRARLRRRSHSPPALRSIPCLAPTMPFQPKPPRDRAPPAPARSVPR